MTRHALIIAVIVVQILCAIFFVSDIVISVFGLRSRPTTWQMREMLEIGAGLGLLLGVILGAVVLRRATQRTAVAEEGLRRASTAFMEVVEEHFQTWGLTPAERDVALFTLKGMSLSEIAGLRGKSDGTIKAQTNAIYRKAGVTSRSQLISIFIEDLMAAD